MESLRKTLSDEPPWSARLIDLRPSQELILPRAADHDLLVLSGAIAIEAEEFLLGKRDYARLPASTVAWSGGSGARVVAFGSPARAHASTVVGRVDTREWRQGAAPGILIADLRNDEERVFMLRLDAGTQVRAHSHPRGEDIYLLDGLIDDGARWIRPDGFSRMWPGQRHAPRAILGSHAFVKSGHLPLCRPW